VVQARVVTAGGKPERGDGIRAELGRKQEAEAQASEAGAQEGRRGTVACDASGNAFLEQLRERLVERVGQLDGGGGWHAPSALRLVMDGQREVERPARVRGEAGEDTLAREDERHAGEGLDALPSRPDHQVRAHLLEIEAVPPEAAHRVDEEQLASLA